MAICWATWTMVREYQYHNHIRMTLQHLFAIVPPAFGASEPIFLLSMWYLVNSLFDIFNWSLISHAIWNSPVPKKYFSTSSNCLAMNSPTPVMPSSSIVSSSLFFVKFCSYPMVCGRSGHEHLYTLRQVLCRDDGLFHAVHFAELLVNGLFEIQRFFIADVIWQESAYLATPSWGACIFCTFGAHCHDCPQVLLLLSASGTDFCIACWRLL